MKFEQDIIENSENKIENTQLRGVGFVYARLLLVFVLRLIQLWVSRSTIMGGRQLKLGKMVKWVYERLGCLCQRRTG